MFSKLLSMAPIVSTAFLVGSVIPTTVLADSINYDDETNTAFMTIDEPFGGTAHLAMRFGGTLQEFLKFDRADDRFEFSNGVYIEGDLEVSGQTTFNSIAYTWPASPATHAGQVLKANPSTGQLSWEDTDTIVVKTVDEIVNNSSAFQADDELTISIPANETWLLRFYLTASSATTPDFKFQLQGQAGATCRFTVGDIEGASGQSTTDCDDSPASTGLVAGSSANPDPYIAWALYTQGDTGGSVTLNWAQNTANASNTTIYQGSFLSARRVQ